MTTTATSPSENAREVYHDIYDFSIWPVSLGDILTWGVKSALRATATGRKRVQIHLICDPQKSGFNPLQGSNYLVDLLVVEALPAFYSHPLFSGISLYRSRDDYHAAFFHINKDDETARAVYEKNEALFKNRSDFAKTVQGFKDACSYHEDINACFKQTGTLPKIGFLEDCLVDWHALQSQFPKETFWVTVQFRYRKMDGGMPVSEEGLRRDAPFLTWYSFICEAYKQYPFVRFVLLGRVQEKPLELLRQPNVVVLRPLGMNLGHEITALINSDLYMGSPSGFAQAAHFSDVPYDIFNCTAEGCKNYGIPYGTEHLPNATHRQRLHYDVETPEVLLESLTQALEEAPRKSTLPGSYEISRSATLNRFFVSDAQSDTELTEILPNRLMAVALLAERGEYSQAQDALRKLGGSFPEFAPRWPEFKWLSGALDALLSQISAAQRTEWLAQVSSYCHPIRLVRRNGRYFETLLGFEGLQRDGWCEQKSTFAFSPGNKGDFLVIQVAGLATSEPVRLIITINQQKAAPFILLNEFALLEIPIETLSVPTQVTLQADRAFQVNARDETKYSYRIEGAGLITGQTSTLTRYRGDKRDSREKILSGIYSNGLTSNIARIRIDNPLPAEVEIMLHIDAHIPGPVRKGQHCRIQINDQEPHECYITGKHFKANIPCPGSPRHLSVLLQFWDRDGAELEPRENRAMIRSIDVVPATVKNAEFLTGYRGHLNYLFNKLKSKKHK